MKRHRFELLLALIFMASIAWTQPNEWRQGCSYSNPEMKSYITTTVIPMVAEQREHFEQSLSQEDRRVIAGIRSDLSTFRAQHREMRTRIHERGQTATIEQRQELRRMRNQREVLMDEVSNIAAKHEHELTQILATLRQEIDAKLDEKCPERSERPRRLQGERRMRGEARGAGRNQESNRFHFRRLLTPEGFLLFDHASYTPGKRSENENNPLRINIFPNPASEEVQVSVMLNEQSEVKIKLLDRNGQELFNVSETAAEGVFAKTIDLDHLNDGLYIVKVETAGNLEIKRLIVKR